MNQKRRIKKKETLRPRVAIAHAILHQFQPTSHSCAKVPKNMCKSFNRNLIPSNLPADAVFNNNNYYDCAILEWNGIEYVA